MKSNLRGKFRDFLASEEGRVGTKAPLAVGIAGASLLLAQAMLPTDAQAHITCKGDNDCDAGEVCVMWQELEWSPGLGDWIWVKHSECINA